MGTTERNLGMVLAAVVCAGAAALSLAAAGEVPLVRTDLYVYLSSVRAVKGGTPLYDFVAPSGFPFTYPPFALMTFWPLDQVPESSLRVAWVIALYGAAAACVLVPGRRMGVAWAPALVGVAALYVSAPMTSNVKYVQVSLLLAMVCLLDGLGPAGGRLRGVPIGLAAAIKLIPLIFVCYFLVTGQRKAAARSALTFCGCTALAWVAFPSASWTYWTSAVFQPSRTGSAESHMGIGDQSIRATLMRLGLPPDPLWVVLGAGVCVAVLVAARSLCRAGRDVEAVVAIGCASLLASPVSWTHHQVWAVLAGLLLLTYPSWGARLGGALILAITTVHPKIVAGLLQHGPGAGVLAANGRALGALACCVAACVWAYRLNYANDRYITLT